jgi:competence protein ComGC
MKSFLKQEKGISLVALIITIIVMMILAGVTVANMIIDNGIIEKAIKVKDETQKNEMLEKIKTEYFALKRNEENKEKSNKEIFEILKEKLNLSAEFIGSESMIIEMIEDEYITLLEDGTIIEGKN